MIHTVKIDYNYPTGKKLITEMRQYTEAVTFEDPTVVNDVVPEGYMTSSEFRKNTREHLDKVCRENGLL